MEGYWWGYFNYQRRLARIEQEIFPYSDSIQRCEEYDENSFDYLKRVLEMIQLHYNVREEEESKGSLILLHAAGNNQGGFLGLGGSKEFVDHVGKVLTKGCS